MALDADPRTDLGVTVQVGQGAPIPGFPDSGTPLVDVTVAMPASEETDTTEYTLVLRGERAIALGRMLVSAGRAVAR
jgi:hypothetical protein